ncbi:TetR/AcrR family transcriptional regulator [soil metagenome]
MSDPRPLGPDLRRAILDEARGLLLSDGYNSLSMRKIARAVGCSATSIYLHFESKDALVHALIDEGMARLYSELQATAAEFPEPLERLEAMCFTYIRWGLANPEYYEVMFLLHPERMARYPAANYRKARRNLDIFADAIGEASTSGELGASDAHEAASVMWSTTHGTVSLLLARRIDVRMPDDQFVTLAVRHAIQGLRTDPSPVR